MGNIDYGNNVGIVPLTDAAGITQKFKKGKHYGIDIAWSTKANDKYCEVLAWQDGVVVDGGFGAEVGNFLVIEHTYTTGKRWTCYIHLKDKPNLKKGDKVTFGKQMGNARRGTSGHSTGVHLHLYLTKIVQPTVKYTWERMKQNCIDPLPYLYYSSKYNTEYISKDWTKPLPEPTPPTPPKYKIGDKVILNGWVFKSADAKEPSGTVRNKTTYVTRYAEGTKHPYNTTGDLGWCNEGALTLAPTEEYYIVAEGDTLVSISDKNKITLEELCDLNPQLITVGQKLRIK